MPSEFNRQFIEEYRATGGHVTGRLAGRPILLLTTIGAKSGQPHTTPVNYVEDGDRVAVIASSGGSPKHPAWYHNLVAQPHVTVEVGTDTYEATAVVTSGEDRQRLFDKMAAMFSFFADYQAGVTREIPVVALERLKA